MAKNLVIVESPAKAKTIEGFLGKDYLVKSSFGHVRDLASKELGIDVSKNFKPNYKVMPDKKAIITELKKLCEKAELVWLATDEDREGEAISWHLAETLNLDEKKIRRIVFHEITKSAILKAIESPRKIDHKLVDAQQARRILDRLVGFELSPVLWKKVKPSLSAGRVQSVAVRMIVEREQEIENFKSVSSFKITANFKLDSGQILKAELDKRFQKKEDALAFLQDCKNAKYSVDSVETKPGKKSPAAPFTTSTLQQEASRKLGYSVAQTMVLAQRLYEAGKITYMRTDSLNLSETAIGAAKAEIISSFGADYANPKKYITKSKGAQEAHEAIRPTYMENKTVEGDSGEKKLYELIWKRTIASQMADALLEKTTATISVTGRNEMFVAQGEVLRFDGFLKVYIESKDDEEDENDENMLPPISVGQSLNLNTTSAVQRFSHHPPRYSEASLVKKLEEYGIGRPSTYAPTISTIQKRGYVVKESKEGVKREYIVITLANSNISEEIKTENTGAEKNKLFPTDIGKIVNEYLMNNFSKILDYGFTASVEKEFDEIAEGQIKWNKMIEQFYGPFHQTVEHAIEHSEKATGERLLGVDPSTGKNIYVKIGRFGPMVQLGETTDEEKPRFAGIKGDISISEITLEQALEFFKLPKTLGVFEGKELTVAIGRFGPYVKSGNEFFSVKDKDPIDVTLEDAIEIINAKRKADKEKVINEFPEKDVKVLNGRFGPYIAIGKKNFKIPKGTEPSSLTLEDCLKIAEESKDQPKRGFKRNAKKGK